MTVTHFDQATWLAHRAIDAEAIGPPKPPTHVTLPGAKTALAVDRLQAHQAQGRDAHEIVARENARWNEANADRLARHGRWVQGPYHRAIEQARADEMERIAEDARRRARIEALLGEEV